MQIAEFNAKLNANNQLHHFEKFYEVSCEKIYFVNYAVNVRKLSLCKFTVNLRVSVNL